jgi:hypothetical protein
MDLTMLSHLSERALREEAARRGIDAGALDRSQLIVAIREHAACAATLPPATPLAFAATLPPSEGPPEGALGTARSLLERVVTIARTALPRRSEPPPPPAEQAPDEPIRTRSMARLLEEQGHFSRALAIVGDLAARSPGDAELRVWRAALEERLRTEELRALARARLDAVEGELVEVLAAHGARGVAWRVTEAGVARAAVLLASPGALTLRVIRVRAYDDRSVESRLEDRRPLERSGWARLDAPPGARLVVSVGLWDGERFASIAHGAG